MGSNPTADTFRCTPVWLPHHLVRMPQGQQRWSFQRSLAPRSKGWYPPASRPSCGRLGTHEETAESAAPRSQFARVVKGVDLRSTTGNCAWVRTSQLTPSDAPPGVAATAIWCGCRRLSSGGHLSAALRPAAGAGIQQQSRTSCERQGTRRETAESAALRSQFARVVKGADLRSTTGNCA